MLIAAVHHHRPHLVLLVVGLLVLAGIVYLVGRAVRRPRRHSEHGVGRGSVVPDSEPAHAEALATPAVAVGIPSAGVAPPTLSRPVHRKRTWIDGEWAVEVHGLVKRFGSTAAVDGVDLFVPRGSAFGYLGPNGAGKTTLIRTLLGLTRADAGSMALLGIPVPEQRARALGRVGAIVDEPRFHGHLTGHENLRLMAAARGDGADARIAPALARVGLSRRADDDVAAYSMGMRQRLGVAACLLGDPELLILDEPMNGLDPAGMREMREMIDGLVDEGRTVMLSSHLLDEVERTCDAVAIVDRGRVVRQGPIDELIGGTGSVVRIRCTPPERARSLLDGSGLGATVTVEGDVLTVTLPIASRETIAEVNRRLVEAGVGVSGIEAVRTTLEDWFLSVTSTLGGPPAPESAE